MKRILDIMIAFAGLLLAAPLILLCAAAIKLESRGPVFYRASRVGRGGADLRVLKFRKMRNGAGGQALTEDRDPRFTRIGRLLARTRLDEVPQLVNVLVGEMSLVGPRPEDRRFVDLHADAFRQILTVRPGITGLCQLAFARESEILDPADRVGHYVERILPQKVGLDCLYAERRSLGLDIRILVWTFLPVLLRKDVAVHRATARLTLRRRAARAANVSESNVARV
ncbi:MAG: sugar transferase [Gaiella sp.]|nr:sugar transferase [Gaiella sp.]